MSVVQPSLKIRIARNESELEKIYRFRYQVYIKELNRKQEHVNHDQAIIKESLDLYGVNIIAERGSEIIGAARVNFSTDPYLERYIDFYKVANFDRQLNRSAVVTKFMVAKSRRGRALSLLLAKACYQVGLDHDVHFTFIDCYPHLIQYFKKLGFKEYQDNLIHPEFGLVTPMVLVNQDLAYLKEINSPFYKISNTSKIKY